MDTRKNVLISVIFGILLLIPGLGFAVGTITVTVCSSECDSTTIQGAINIANLGDTITVASGTYAEDLIIATDDIELIGADKTTTTIKGIQNVYKDLWPLAVPNIDIQADGVIIHGFTIEGPDYVADYYASGMLIDGTDVEIYDNNFVTTAAENTDEVGQAITTYSKTAIPTADVSGLNIHDNTITCSGATGCEGIYINPHTGLGVITINNNQFLGTILIGISVESGNIDVINNDIINSGAQGWYGIRFFDTSYAATYDNIVVTGNTIQNEGSGIRIGNSNPGSSVFSATLGSNTFTDTNYDFDIRNGASIQDAIDGASAGDTISVAAGIYEEAVIIDKSLTILGAKAGVDARTRTFTGESVLDGSGITPVLGLSAFKISDGVTDVTIDGFEIRNYYSHTSPYSSGSGNAIFAFFDAAWPGSTGTSSITVQNNYMHDLGHNAILVGSMDGFTQSGWLVQKNLIEEAPYAAIELTNVIDSQVLDNKIVAPTAIVHDPGDAGVGIEIAVRARSGQTIIAGTNIIVQGNEITGAFPLGPAGPWGPPTISRAGINLLSRTYASDADATLLGVIVRNNIVSDGGENLRAGIVIVAESRYNGPATISSITINGNDLDGNDDGIEIEDKIGTGSSISGTHSSITIGSSGEANQVRNSISSGLHVLSGTSANGITLNYNEITGNTAFGVNNAGTGTLNAENNWWGAATGPNTAGADSVSANVDFAPYYTDSAMTTLSTEYSVCDSGCNFVSIQEAIDAASSGDTINVAAGTYDESLAINKGVILQGAGKDETILEGYGESSTAVSVYDDNVVITGFGIQNYNTGVNIQADYVTITDNKFYENSYRQIYAYSSTGVAITNNEFDAVPWASSSYGVYFSYVNLSTISNNTIKNHDSDGIYIRYSTDISVDDNTLEGNNYRQIYAYSSTNVDVTNNNLYGYTYTTDYGVYFDNVDPSTISGNYINGSEDGIYIYESMDITIQDNIASSNTDTGIYLYSSTNTALIDNNASDNYDGIYLSSSSNNTLRGNKMTGNVRNFNIRGSQDYHFDHDIDFSNTVDGKPVYYVKGASEKTYSSSNIGWFGCVNCDGVTVKDFTLTNNGPGLLFWNTNNSNIRNMTISDNRDGIRLYHSWYVTIDGNTLVGNNDQIEASYSNYVDVTGNNIYGGSTSDGIEYDWVNWSTISGNYINGSTSDGIELDYSADIVIDSNTLVDNDDQIDAYSSTNVDVTNNNIYGWAGTTSDGVYIRYSTNITVDNNTIEDSSYSQIYAYSSTNVDVTNNNIYGYTYTADYGVYFDYVDPSTISDNYINGSDEGIYIYESMDITIDNNTVEYIGCNGISLDSSSSNNITNNTVENSGIEYFGEGCGNGISLEDSSENNITNNEVSHNAWNGIKINPESYNNWVLDNIVEDNDNAGIRIAGSYNTVTGNEVSGTNPDYYWGIGIVAYSDEGGDGGNVFINNTLNNVYNAYDDDSWYESSVWDLNFYSDYDGVDLNGDFIGDTMLNYSIDGEGMEDEHPRTSDCINNNNNAYTYASIQSAVDNASEGDTITVCAGTFYEEITIIEQPPITLQGAGKDETILEGYGWSSTAVSVYDDNVVITGFGIQNYDVGVEINADYVTITDNKFYDNGLQIYAYSSTGVTISENELESSYYGIFFGSLYEGEYEEEYEWEGVYGSTISENTIKNSYCSIALCHSSYNTLDDNQVVDNGGGISLYADSDYNSITNSNISNNEEGYGIEIDDGSDHNLIDSNAIENNDYGGIYLSYGWSNTITGNTISNNHGEESGIYLDNEDMTLVSGNTITENDGDGISLYYAYSNTITGNVITDNENYGIYLTGSDENTIYNNLFDNPNNAYDDWRGKSNYYNITKTAGINIIGGSWMGGNYWALPNGTGFSETCTDADTDGICDSGRDISGGSNVDYLPLTDATPPSLALLTPAESQTLPTSYAAFTFFASDNLASTLGYNLSVDGAVNESGTATGGANTTVTVGGFTDGAHTWSVAVWDNAGNVNTSETRNFTIKTTQWTLPPVVVPPIVNTTNGSGVVDLSNQGVPEEFIEQTGVTGYEYLVTTNGTTPTVNISVNVFIEAPPGTSDIASESGAVPGFYYQINVNDTSWFDNVTEIQLKIYYNISNINLPSGVSESTLRPVRYTSGSWVRLDCSALGGCTATLADGTELYAAGAVTSSQSATPYVWANLSNFSCYGVGGSVASAAVGQGDIDHEISIVGIKVPGAVMPGETATLEIALESVSHEPNVKINLELPWSSKEITTTLLPGTSTREISFTVPEDASAGDYTVKVKAVAWFGSASKDVTVKVGEVVVTPAPVTPAPTTPSPVQPTPAITTPPPITPSPAPVIPLAVRNIILAIVIIGATAIAAYYRFVMKKQ